MRDMMFGQAPIELWLPYILARFRRQPQEQRFSTRRINAAKPGTVRVAQTTTAITSGFQFRFYLVGGNVSGYRVYRSTINNANVASIVDFIPQPPTHTSGVSFTWQETTTGTPFYWVATVSETGTESARVPMTGTAAPTPPPSGGDPGSGGGGGPLKL